MQTPVLVTAVLLAVVALSCSSGRPEPALNYTPAPPATAAPTPAPTSKPRPTAEPIPSPAPALTATAGTAPHPFSTRMPSPTPTPLPTAEPRPSPAPAPTATPKATPHPSPIPVSTPTHTPVPTVVPAISYLTEEIPPCTPVPGSLADPCEPDAEQYAVTEGGIGAYYDLGDEPWSIRELFKLGRVEHTHIVVRGTYLSDTLRCTAENPYQPPSYLSYNEYDYIQYSLSVNCYVDMRVGAYILGDGPSTLTVQRFFDSYWHSGLARIAEAEGMTREELIENRRRRDEAFYSGAIVGREEVLFLGPAASISTEVWEVFEFWDVQRSGDGTVIAVHPYRDLWRTLRPQDYPTHRSKLEMALPAFTQEVAAAHEARVTENGGRIGTDATLPMLETDANRLREYYTVVGAFNDTDVPPAPPPPPCGLAVSDQADNPGLMQDCVALLAAKDTLRGSAALNWSVDTAITGWDGVTTGGTPSRVTKLLLQSKGLSGSIPGELGNLSGLTHLNLSSNSLTGEIPWELGMLSNVTEIRLSGNSLTGCIPPALKDVTTNDLSSLSLLYCPQTPGGLAAGTPGETSVPLSWTAVANAGKYRVEYRDAYYRRWVVDGEAITGASHAVDGLRCWSSYQFRVMAYGDGTTNAAEWSAPSALITAGTTECVSPVFGDDPYEFSVAEDAAIETEVGIVSAADPQDDTVTYSITDGQRRRAVRHRHWYGSDHGRGSPGLRDHSVSHIDGAGQRRYQHGHRGRGDRRDRR